MAKHLPPAPTNGQNIRIRCECFAEVDPASMAELRRLGWTKISRVRSWKDAGTTYDDPREQPPGFSALDWETHYGVCPDCTAEGVEE